MSNSHLALQLSNKLLILEKKRDHGLSVHLASV